MIIMKFGGTSVNTKERLETICKIVKKEQNRSPIIVVSALRGVTDLLLSLFSANNKEQQNILGKIEYMHKNLVKDFYGFIPNNFINKLESVKKEITMLLNTEKIFNELQDEVVAFGEILSSHIIALALTKKDIYAEPINASAFIVTNNCFGSADFIPDKTRIKTQKILLPLIKNNITLVITGFIGATENGKVTTLGRGGSDYSASILGYCLGAEEIQFWKDVDGVYTADPRAVKNAKLIKNLSYKEASILIESGAKILHPRAIFPICEFNIPVRVMNSFHPERVGTLIGNRKGILL